jgi:type I restriction enzyme S subunit
VKNGWQRKKVSEIAQHSLGKMLDKAKNKGELKPYLRNLNVRWFGFDLSDVLEMRFLPTEEAKYTAVKGDVLVCEGGYPGRAAIWEQDEPIYFQKALHRVRFYQPEHNKWFLYYLHACDLDGTLKKHFNGAGIQHFTGEALNQFEIPLPPLPEQRRIIDILDDAFNSIATAKANAEKNLQNARALFESHLQAVFTQRGEGWREKPLAELCDIKHGFAFKSEFFASEGDYVVLTPGNFYESGGYRDRGEKQKYYSGEIPRGFILDKGDLLVAMTEQAAGLLGSPILVPESDKFLHNQRLGLVTKKPGVSWTNEFFFHVFNTKAVRKEIHDSASGVKVRHTSPTKIGEVIVSFPTAISEQRAIVSNLADLHEETQRLESIYRRKLATLDELKKSLLHQAFNGEL